ncbi:hypothetical protein SARC_01887 [Sphaeroforma arctica JP610]|uniref:Uncharacterized protein n=1 Tax=Sphaeroforma arctica JP610 TaxID=667725 RepID=A0A0L0GAB6_9EUKA|nr:hypothetical protein SARC_01887 [Sphaeroforma arctica JP610]KNC85940.1 hypothetical protein SARC_01887 [Sphaeroforma arctica JP610]|eukprot:XP_014159842.1 hypothetical protein SARC_01887 [Sphaeroforma arctica JP610]
MDESRPLWEMYTVSNLKDAGPDGDSNGVVYMRIHHNIGDGISLIALVLKIFDKPPIVNKRAPKSLPNIWPKVPPVLNACHTIRMMVQGVFEGVLFTLLPGDIDTVLKVPNVGLLGERHVATSSKVDLEKIKDIKEKIGGTVNDVLIALLTGVLRRYLVANCSKTDGQIRALCLINMRDKSKMMTKHIELENQWNFLPIPVPCGMTDPLDRLYFCKVYCDDQKISPANLVAYNLNNVVGKIVPPDIFCGMTYDLFNKCTTVFSNVPGPQGDVEMQGQKVQSISFYSNSLSGTVFGLVSYNNAVQLSVAADKAVIADPQALVDHVHDEIDELHRAVQGDFRKPALDMKRTGLDLTVTLLSILLLFNLVKAAIYALLYMIGIF